jgi:predicted PurR-regulated permease PerM
MTTDWTSAVDREDLAAIERLLGAGADIDARDEHGQTALMNAARDGRTAVVRLLVHRGADLDHAAKYGLTALMLAVLRGHVEVVRILAEAGADRDRRGTGAPGFAGKTALDLAAGLEHAEMVGLLERDPRREPRPAQPAALPATPVAGWVTLIAALVVALYLCWQIVEPFAHVLLWALVLAIVFAPVHRRIDTALGRPGLSAAVSTVLVILTIVGPVSFLTVAVVAELRSVALSIDTTQSWMSPDAPVIGPLIGWISQYVDLDLEQMQSPDFVRTRLEAWSGMLANSTLGLVGGVASTALQMVLVVFTLYYLFRDGTAIRRGVTSVIPIGTVQARDIMARTMEVVGASVYGVITIAAIQGALGSGIFWAIGLPSPLLWGVVMFVLSMIPMAGAFLVWVPAALYLAVTGAWMQAAILTAWGILVIGTVDNLLRPRLVGRRTRMHELLVFFGVLGGIDAFGVIGVILGPVVIAITLALLEIVRHAGQVSQPAPVPTSSEPDARIPQES